MRNTVKTLVKVSVHWIKKTWGPPNRNQEC